MLKPRTPRRSLVAAAARIKIDNTDEVRRVMKRRQKWQELGWMNYDVVAELHDACNYIGNTLAKIILFPALRAAPDQDPQPLNDPIAQDILDGLASPLGGYGDILRELAINLVVAGEALDLETLIPTPTGFARLADLKVGDKVLSGDGEPCEITRLHPILHDRPCYEVQLTGDIRVVADANHLWLATNALGRARQSYREKVRDDLSVPREPIVQEDVADQVVSTQTMLETLKYRDRVVSNWSIETTTVRGTHRADLPIDPYVLGYWLGDGVSVQGAICIHPDDQPYLKARVEDAGYIWSPRPGDRRGFSIGIRGLQKQLRLAGLLGNKHVPAAYLRASESQRWALLQGLMDSDGHVDAQGRCEFSNVNHQLLWDVVEIAASLGLKPSRPSSHRVYFKSAGKPVVSLPRKAERISSWRKEDSRRYVQDIQQVKSRPVRCITVDSPDQTFLVTERFVKTHNCYLVGLAGTDAEAETVYDIRSIDEVVVSGDGRVKIKGSPLLAGARELGPNDYWLRIWLRHPRWSDLADSPLRPLLSVCEQLLLLERERRAISRSRIAGAGLLLMSEGMTFGVPDPTQSTNDGEGRTDPFLDDLLETMMTAIKDEGDAAAVVPPIVMGKPEQIAATRLLTFDRPYSTQLDSDFQRQLDRLAQGLPLPPDVLKGMARANHWSAWQIDESKWKDYLEPFAMLAFDALTVGYLRPALTDLGHQNAADAVIWYDASKVILKPDRGQDIKDAHSALAASDEALLSELGFPEAYAPTEEERTRRLLERRGTLDPALTDQWVKLLIARELARLGDTASPIAVAPSAAPAPAPAPALPAGAPPDTGSTGPKPSASPAPPGPPSSSPDAIRPASIPPLPGETASGQITAALPGSPIQASLKNIGLSSTMRAQIAAAVATSVNSHGRRLGRRLAALDRDIRTRLLIAADSAVTRALERAGASLRSKARRDREARALLSSVSDRLVALTLGESLVSALGVDDTQIAKAFDAYRKQWEAWVRDAQETTLDMFALSGTARVERELAFAESRASAWAWLETQLLNLVHQLLYEPSLDLPGESDLSLNVPAGLIREAVARAGGAGEGGTSAISEYGAYVGLLNNGLEPLGGIGTGEIVKQLLAEQGGGIEGYEWDYGAYPRRTFEPHAELDGVVFSNFDDPVLANANDFPATPFLLPGDHAGCLCSYTPVIVAPNLFPGVVEE